MRGGAGRFLIFFAAYRCRLAAASALHTRKRARLARCNECAGRYLKSAAPVLLRRPPRLPFKDRSRAAFQENLSRESCSSRWRTPYRAA